jgi:GntR family transcriptional regulator
VAHEAPKHERIAADLRALIAAGELQDGDQLPGENALMERYSVARMTARQALADLQSQGVAVARKGQGVFVRTFQPVRRFGNRRLSRTVWGTGQSMWAVDDGAGVPQIDDIHVDTLPVPDDVAHLLAIPVGAPIVRRDRRYLIDDRPVQRATAYIPADIATGTAIAELDTGPGGIYARLAELGRTPVRFVEEIQSRMPTLPEKADLQLPAGTPVFVVMRTALDAHGHPVEVSRMLLSAAAYVLVYESHTTDE